MDLSTLVDALGESGAATATGLVLGLAAGAAIRRAGFCLNGAVAEIARARPGAALAVLLLTLGAALTAVQGAAALGLFDPALARPRATTGSWSGAVLGGLIFGVGMVLARGCPARLIARLGTRAEAARAAALLVIFAASVQLSLRGTLAPLRAALAGAWVTAGGVSPDLTALAGLPPGVGLALGLAVLTLGALVAGRTRLARGRAAGAVALGLVVLAAYLATFALSQAVFDPISVSGISFAGPAASALMALLTGTGGGGVDPALVAGALVGAMLAGLVARSEGRAEGAGSAPLDGAALAGVALMGIGATLAGGCSLGAGVSGTAVMAAPAWLALAAMLAGGIVTHRLRG